MAGTWARVEWEGARVLDARRRTSLTTIAERLAVQAGKSFSAAVGQAARQAGHRIFSQPLITPSALLAGHVQQTVQRCRAHPVVLVAQDTTTFNYSSRQSLALGPTNDATTGRGLFGHAAVAFTPQRLPLGVLWLDLWSRDPARHGQKYLRQQRDTQAKESRKWGEAHTAVEKAFAPETAPPRLFLVQDREADVYAFFCRPRAAHLDFLIRAHQPRTVQLQETVSPAPGSKAVSEFASPDSPPEDELPLEGRTLSVLLPRLAGAASACVEPEPTPERRPLAEVVAAAPVLGEQLLHVAAKPRQKARQAQVTVRACRVEVFRPTSLPPAERQKLPASLCLTVLLVEEPEPPGGVEPVQWLLLSTAPVTDAASAWELVGYYAVRWGIERVHQTLKDGLQVERLQFDDPHTLKNGLAAYYVVAWRLLHLTHLARTDPEAPATTVCTAEECRVLEAASQQQVRTARAAVRAIAILGGWEAYPSAGQPGVKALWRGLRDLQGVLRGYQLALRTVSTPVQTYDPS